MTAAATPSAGLRPEAPRSSLRASATAFAGDCFLPWRLDRAGDCLGDDPRCGNLVRMSVVAWIPDEDQEENLGGILRFVRTDQAHVHVVAADSHNDPPQGSCVLLIDRPVARWFYRTPG